MAFVERKVYDPTGVIRSQSTQNCHFVPTRYLTRDPISTLHRRSKGTYWAGPDTATHRSTSGPDSYKIIKSVIQKRLLIHWATDVSKYHIFEPFRASERWSQYRDEFGKLGCTTSADTCAEIQQQSIRLVTDLPFRETLAKIADENCWPFLFILMALRFSSCASGKSHSRRMRFSRRNKCNKNGYEINRLEKS